MSTITQLTQLGFAGSMLLTSLYMSLGFNDCTCDNARVYIPNQIVMIMGVLGVVFTACNCFKNTPFGHSSNTLIPGFIGMICSIVMLTGDSKCENCCDKAPCPEGKKLRCCVSKSPVLWIQLLISLVLAGWGSWATVASYSKKKLGGGKKTKTVEGGKKTKTVEGGKKTKTVEVGKKTNTVEAKDNFADRMKKAKAKKKKLKQEDDYSFISDFK
jgi:hypothetical protein